MITNIRQKENGIGRLSQGEENIFILLKEKDMDSKMKSRIF